MRLQRRTDERLVAAGAVAHRGIEERHAEFHGAMQGGHGLLIVRGPVKWRHTHAAETDGRDFDIAVAKFSASAFRSFSRDLCS